MHSPMKQIPLQFLPLAALLLSFSGCPNTTYYQSSQKHSIPCGNQMGLDLSTLPYFNWELNDSGSVAVDSSFKADGQIFGAMSEWDAELGSSVSEFDGDDDYVDLGTLDEMDQVDRFTISSMV